MHLTMRPKPCTTGQVHLLVFSTTYVKLKSRLSVCPSDRPTDMSAVSAWIDVGLAQYESCVVLNHVVYLYKFSSATVRPHECVKGTGIS